MPTSDKIDAARSPPPGGSMEREKMDLLVLDVGTGERIRTVVGVLQGQGVGALEAGDFLVLLDGAA